MTGHSAKRMLRDQRGVVAIVLGVILVVLMGLTAMAVDLGYLFVLRGELQNTADSSALAGASQLPDAVDVRSAAVQYANRNMPYDDHGDVLVPGDVVLGHWNPDTRTWTAENAAPPSINAVMVTTKRAEANDNPAELFFARILGFDTKDLTTIAIAWPGPGDDEFCILSLEPSDPGAIEISGTNVLDLGECGVAATSVHDPSAMKPPGTVDITAGSLCVAGKIDEGGAVTYTPGPEIKDEGCTPPADPLAGLPPPSYSGCDHTDYVVSDSGGAVTLSPGVYCNGITISGSNVTVNFNPGIYILAGGGMNLSGALNSYNGTEMMFYNTASAPGATNFADLALSGDSTINLSAPTSGPYAGVLFFQDRDPAATEVKFQLSGDTINNLDGVLYFPNQEVVYSGDSNMTNPCGPKIIGKTVKFSGNSTLFGPHGANCASDGVGIFETVLKLVY